MTLQLSHGLHYGVPEADYHRRELGIASSSAITRLLRSPAHYRAWASGTAPEESRPTLDLGKAAHCALLEPERFANDYVVMPDFGSLRANAELGVTTEQGRANKERKRDWLLSHPDVKNTVSAGDMATIRGIARSLGEDPFCKTLLIGGASEVTCRWQCPESGVECKSRIDYWLGDVGVAIDLKTTEDASRSGFRRDARRYGWRRIAAHYLDGLRAVTMPTLPLSYLFLLCEKSEPYACAVYRISEQGVEMGRTSNIDAKMRLANGIRTGEWPGYGSGITDIAFSEGEFDYV